MPATRDQHGHTMTESRLAPSTLDLADAVAEGVQAAFGALSLGLEVALRTLAESPTTVPRRPGPRIPVSEVADVLVGTAWGAARFSGRLAATGARITAPVLGLVLRPPLLPRRLQPAHRVQLMTERWQRDRPEALRTLGRWSATALPGAVDAALGQVDVGKVSTVVLDRVDLTRVATTLIERLDVDVVAAQVLNQLQVEAVAAQVLDQLRLDDLATQVLDQLRLDQLATQVLDQLRLDQLAGQVVGELRVGELAAQVLNQLDLTQLVLDRVDLQRVVAGALDRLDLTAIVVEQVDLGDVVATALQHVDLTQIVMSQVDLIGVAQYVVDGIDLPEIIRDSTGSVASEAVVGLRMQGIDADVLVGRVVDRMLHRRRERRTEQAPEQLGSSDVSGDHPAGNAE
jgi:hypothetical protein